jgi:leucyl aminopeptidase (aminopeptidase T)
VSALDTAVRTVVRDCLGVNARERVLVIGDSSTESLSSRLCTVAEALGAQARTLFTEIERDGQEPPPEVAEAMLASDVVIAATAHSISHTEARREACARGVRIATLPGVTEELLARAMGIDLREVGRLGGMVARRLSEASEAHITCPNGSDLRLSLEGRRAEVDDGRLIDPGSFGNLPCGEAYIAPLEDRGEGRLVVDGSIAGVAKLDEPVELTVEAGRLTAASGPQGERLLELLSAHGGENVAELGVGTNGRARSTGHVLEDEKILGSIHVAFGASASMGGTVQVPVHLDCVVLKPDLALDGEPLVGGGRLLGVT